MSLTSSLKKAYWKIRSNVANDFRAKCVRDYPHVKRALKAAGHAHPSVIASIGDDEITQESTHLCALSCEAARKAADIFIESDKQKEDSCFFNVFPGEHYRILAGLLEVLNPSLLVDIGTHTGMSSRVMLDYSGLSSKVHTFDINEWDNFESFPETKSYSHLRHSDFAGGRCIQHLEDLGDSQVLTRNGELLDNADFIMCDAPKDGIFEYLFLNGLSQIELSSKSRFLFLDDIKFLNMVPLWRNIDSPKFDLTSFGHWSGSGIVDISEGLRLKQVLPPISR